MNNIFDKSSVFKKTSFLNTHYQNISWSQRLWHIKNNILDLVYCKICGKNLAKFTRHGYKYTFCSNKCLSIHLSNAAKNTFKHNKEGILNKSRQTCLSKYGVEYSLQDAGVKEKSRQTCLLKYGVKYPSQVVDVKEKIKISNTRKFGVDSYLKTSECKEKLRKKYEGEYLKSDDYKNKSRQTCLLKYGVDRYWKSKEIKQKIKDTIIAKTIANLSLEYKYVCRGEFGWTLLHTKCSKNFNIKTQLLGRRRRSNLELCTYCNPIHKGWSFGEKEIVSFIKSIYKHEVAENTRSIISPYELDIYLPDLKIAFEFFGTYSHADPRKYTANDMIFYKTAQEIWDKDKLKIKMCKDKGIKLLSIWDADWKANPDAIQKIVADTIFNK